VKKCGPTEKKKEAVQSKLCWEQGKQRSHHIGSKIKNIDKGEGKGGDREGFGDRHRSRVKRFWGVEFGGGNVGGKKAGKNSPISSNSITLKKESGGGSGNSERVLGGSCKKSGGGGSSEPNGREVKKRKVYFY